ncbi:MAG: GtrA family protein [Oscillospiraceae bacterium]|nr:GtrA family protein [Oscillospiraceae bacterium]
MRRKIDALASGSLGETVRYLIAGGLTTLVDMGVFAFATEIMNLSVNAGNALSVSIAVLFAYAANKLVVFRAKSPDRRSLLLEFARFVGARAVTMALEVAVVWLIVGVAGGDKYVGKAAALVLVIISNYILSKLVVFRRT